MTGLLWRRVARLPPRQRLCERSFVSIVGSLSRGSDFQSQEPRGDVIPPCARVKCTHPWIHTDRKESIISCTEGPVSFVAYRVGLD
jgi:hypothetical protein